jgi:hypothetical protein
LCVGWLRDSSFSLRLLLGRKRQVAQRKDQKKTETGSRPKSFKHLFE